MGVVCGHIWPSGYIWPPLLGEAIIYWFSVLQEHSPNVKTEWQGKVFINVHCMYFAFASVKIFGLCG